MKKGLTLIELIAVLTVLAIIALIVTPNILVSVQEYKDQAYETDIEAIADAAKNWAADHIEEIPAPENSSYKTALYLPISELVTNGYFDDDVKDVKNGGTFNDEDHETFAIIICELKTDEFGIKSDNYKYTYEAYTSKKEYIEKKALQYAKDNETSLTEDMQSPDEEVNIEKSDLSGYIPGTITKYNTGNIFNPFSGISEITLSIHRTGKPATYEYEYSVTIN